MLVRAKLPGMKSKRIPPVRVEPELMRELEAVLGEAETVSAFVERAVRGAVKYRVAQGEFLARGEQAWQEYLRTAQSCPAGEVLDRIQERVDAWRQELTPKR
jgi:hypothetical protein